MRTLFAITCCLVVGLAFLIAPAADAAPCSCHKICCIGPHNPGVNCFTECCTNWGTWTTCQNFGTPGCNPPERGNGEEDRAQYTWLDPASRIFAQPAQPSAGAEEAAPADDVPADNSRDSSPAALTP